MATLDVGSTKEVSVRPGVRANTSEFIHNEAGPGSAGLARAGPAATITDRQRAEVLASGRRRHPEFRTRQARRARPPVSKLSKDNRLTSEFSGVIEMIAKKEPTHERANESRTALSLRTQQTAASGRGGRAWTLPGLSL